MNNRIGKGSQMQILEKVKDFVKQTTKRLRITAGVVALLLIVGAISVALSQTSQVSESVDKVSVRVKADKASVKRKAEAEKQAKLKAEADKKAEAEKQAKLKAEAEAKAKAESDAKAKAEAEKAQAEQAQVLAQQQQAEQAQAQAVAEQQAIAEQQAQATYTPPATPSYTPPTQSQNTGSQWGNASTSEQQSLNDGHSVSGGDAALNIYEK